MFFETLEKWHFSYDANEQVKWLNKHGEKWGRDRKVEADRAEIMETMRDVIQTGRKKGGPFVFLLSLHFLFLSDSKEYSN